MNVQMQLMPKASSEPYFTPAQAGKIQRKQPTTHELDDNCPKCTKGLPNLQRSSGAVTKPFSVPPIVHEVLNSPGEPLDAGTRALMEPRFGHNFSKVRVHTDSKAAESARAVNAQAYTVGREVVFGTGQYAPGRNEGQKLLAHELTHVVQQSQRTVNPASLTISAHDDPTEHEAEAAVDIMANGKGSGFSVQSQSDSILQRKIKVDKPKDRIPNPGGKGLVQTNAQTVQDYLTKLCPTGSVAVDSSTGNVNIDKSFCTVPALPSGMMGPPAPSPAQISKTPTGCGCICDLVNSSNLWTIQVDDGSWPHTIPDNPDAADGKKPGGSGGTVTTPSPNSPKLWGAGTASGKELDIDPWLVMGHELCGHGWLADSGKHGPDLPPSERGKGGHQKTVERENALRSEHGIDLRGTFKDPNCGESYWRDKAAPGKVNWSSYRGVCEAWRIDYNKKHGTRYKITDRIP